jgi:hypothetical protein
MRIRKSILCVIIAYRITSYQMKCIVNSNKNLSDRTISYLFYFVKHLDLSRFSKNVTLHEM